MGMGTPEGGRARDDAGGTSGTQHRLQELAALTARRLDTARARLERVRAERRGESEDDEHDPEGVPLSAQWASATAEVEQARRRAAAVEAALGRLAEGAYGRCRACGRPIEAGRLDARPDAELCAACARREWQAEPGR